MKRSGVVFVLLYILAATWLSGCTQRREFHTEMQWYSDREVLGDVLLGQASDEVCLQYVDAPRFYECLFAPGIRARLQAFEREKVRVDFEVTCRSGQVVWYRVLAVDGQDVGIPQNAISGHIGNARGEIPFFGACG